VQNDLDHLRVVIAGELDGADVVVAHMAARARHLGGETDGGVGLDVVGGAGAVGGNLGIVELGEVLAEIGVSGQAVVTAVDLGDRKRNALARRGRQRAFAECAR
jgi:hypothetical protein